MPAEGAWRAKWQKMEGVEPRYVPACRDTTKIVPGYDFLSKLVVVSAACREKKSKMYPSTRSPGKRLPPPPPAYEHDREYD